MQPRTERRTGALSRNKGKHYRFVCWQSPLVNDNGRQSDCGDLLCDLVETKGTKKKLKLAAMIGCLCCRVWHNNKSASGHSAVLCPHTGAGNEPQRSGGRQRQVPICSAALLGLASSREWVAVGALLPEWWTATRRAGGHCRAPLCSGRRRSPPAAAPPGAGPSSPRPSRCCRRTASRTRDC